MVPPTNSSSETDWVGSQWLAREFGAEPVQPFPIRTRVGGPRPGKSSDAYPIDTIPASRRPEPTFAANLAFALRREAVHIEFLARLFRAVPRRYLEHWIRSEPSGRHARRAGFLFEWLTGETLDVPGHLSGGYVDVLDANQVVVSSTSRNSTRWRVRDNLPGTRFFCPTVRRTPGVRTAETVDFASRLAQLGAEYGDDVLIRSAVWLTLKESRSSFQIEQESSQTDRIRRFAAAMEQRIGTDVNPLGEEFLRTLQRDILGENALRIGLRRSPVFIGETRQFGETIHYVAPHWDQIGGMLDGLRQFETSTRGASSIIRAAVLSFGFVYIHPMADGNGRISRFLVNETLRRDGAVPAPFLLPISASITRSAADRASYDRALEAFSRPFMRRYADACKFGKRVVCDDGIETNFQFEADDDARFTWSFPDLTTQCEYLHGVVEETIDFEWRREADWLVEWHRTRARIKEIVEAPDVELDRIIRSVRENNGRLSGKLRDEFPFLHDQSTANAILDAIVGSHPSRTDGNNVSGG